MQQRAENFQSSELLDYLDSSNLFYQDLLGYKPEQTQLQRVPENQWSEFTQTKGLNPNSSGIYLPRNQTAVIQGENPLSLFHEYFGHGLYCEQSLSGMELVDLEKILLEEEKQEFKGRQFTLEDLQRFRQENKIFHDLKEFRRRNLQTYEGFAVFTEFLLSREFGLKDEFERKYDSLEKRDKESVDSAIIFNQTYGSLATFYGFGLRKVQDRKRLLRLSQDIFCKALERTKLIMHFGSGKSFSDVDLFVVSNDIGPFYSEWIDVRTSRVDDIEDRIKILDPKVTDPIMVGKLIWGDENYLKRIKQKVLNQPITEKAIEYNFQQWRYHARKSQDSTLNEHFQSKNLRSSKTYLTNALALKDGDKVLTFNGLVDYSHSLSRSEKFIELKGGIE